jgi:hypothetical protein
MKSVVALAKKNKDKEDNCFKVIGRIVYAKNESIDLIVVGTSEVGKFKRLLLGCVAFGVITYIYIICFLVTCLQTQYCNGAKIHNKP